MTLTAYDIYRYLESALDYYMDSIAIQEDPTEEERKDYECIKYWRPSIPDQKVKEILSSIVFNGKNNESEKES